MMRAYKTAYFSWKDLWADLITAFSPSFIEVWSRFEVSEWFAFIKFRGIHLEDAKRRRKTSILVGVFYWEAFKLAQTDPIVKQLRFSEKQAPNPNIQTNPLQNFNPTSTLQEPLQDPSTHANKE